MDGWDELTEAEKRARATLLDLADRRLTREAALADTARRFMERPAHIRRAATVLTIWCPAQHRLVVVYRHEGRRLAWFAGEHERQWAPVGEWVDEPMPRYVPNRPTYLDELFRAATDFPVAALVRCRCDSRTVPVATEFLHNALAAGEPNAVLRRDSATR